MATGRTVRTVSRLVVTSSLGEEKEEKFTGELRASGEMKLIYDAFMLDIRSLHNFVKIHRL